MYQSPWSIGKFVFLLGQWSLGVGFARALRAAFQDHHTFRWNPNERLSKIFIYDQWPLIGCRYPNIIVTVQGGPALLRGIGGEVALDDFQNSVSINGASHNLAIGTIYSGNMYLTVQLTISARTSYERAEIADWIILFLRHFAPDKFTREGVNLADIQMGPQTAQLLGSDPVYSTSLSVKCLTSFSREIPIALSGTVDGICIVGVFTSINGATFGDSV